MESWGTWKTFKIESEGMDIVPMWQTCIVEPSTLWIIGDDVTGLDLDKDERYGVISLQQAESRNQEDDVLDVLERAEEDAMLRRK